MMDRETDVYKLVLKLLSEKIASELKIIDSDFIAGNPVPAPPTPPLPRLANSFHVLEKGSKAYQKALQDLKMKGWYE